MLFGLILLAAIWVGIRLYQAYHNLDTATGLVQTIKQELKDGDTKGAANASYELQIKANAANDAAHDPLWGLAEHVPLLGNNLTAVRVVAETVDSLSTKTLPPLIDVADSLDPKQLAPKEGVIAVDKLAAAAPEVIAADEAVQRAQQEVAGIDRSHLLNVVGRGVQDLQKELASVRQDSQTAARAARVLPTMLGADGPRTYLLAFQNPAELRATGGLFGAYALVTADHGKITLQDAGGISTLINKRFNQPVLPLTEQQLNLYTDRLGIHVGDTNLTPDFPTAAKITREMYRLSTGKDVDGVIATDPVALSYILKGTGPIIAAGHRITADNAVKFLLADVYQIAPTSRESDELFAETTKAVFSVISSGQGDSRATLNGLEKAASERRVLVWNADEKLQSDLQATVLGGTLPASDIDTPTVGLFLNDGTGAKMDYYLTRQATLTQQGCEPDGRMKLSLNVILHTDAPSKGLPDLVTGLAMGGSYVTRTIVMIFTPTGGTIDVVDQDGKRIVPGLGTEGGRSVAAFQVDLKPGGSSHLTITMRSGPTSGSSSSGLDLRTTPMATAGKTTIGPVTACRPR